MNGEWPWGHRMKMVQIYDEILPMTSARPAGAQEASKKTRLFNVNF